MSDTAWTGHWVAKKLEGEQEVERIQLLAPQQLQVVRKTFAPVIVGTTAAERLDAAALEPLLLGDPCPSFVVNVPRESYIVHSALELASRRKIGIGGLGDLKRALALADVRKYVNPDVRFVERGLRQHSKVKAFKRIDDRLYSIERSGLSGLSTLRVVFINPYEVTADALRTAVERYGACDVVVNTNPNGRATASARATAADLSCQLCMWREFFRVLNTP